MKNLCNFTCDKCWYEHKVENNNSENLIEMDDPVQSGNEQTAKLPVFQNPPGNLAPPSSVPTPMITQATWIKMKSIVADLKQMMENVKQFQ
jgi:hypothetical protein